MGQKVNPFGFRLGFVRDWKFKWYAKDKYGAYLSESLKIRSFILNKMKHAEIGDVEISRYLDRIVVTVKTGRPGLVIGKKGSEIEALKKDLAKITIQKLQINVQEIANPYTNATILAQYLRKQLMSRVSYKRAMKQMISNVMRLESVKGIRILVSGRLGGAEMARREHYKEGRIPLHTLRADIDYGVSSALTKFGIIGIKVWLFKGEILSK